MISSDVRFANGVKVLIGHCCTWIGILTIAPHVSLATLFLSVHEYNAWNAPSFTQRNPFFSSAVFFSCFFHFVYLYHSLVDYAIEVSSDKKSTTPLFMNNVYFLSKQMSACLFRFPTYDLNDLSQSVQVPTLPFQLEWTQVARQENDKKKKTQIPPTITISEAVIQR